MPQEETFPRLVACEGHFKGSTFPMTGEISIGRDASNTLRLNDPLVSRRHVVIREAKQRFLIVDSGSHNGTFVNGVPVRERQLEHGDQIRIGDSLFVFVSSPEDQPVASPHVHLESAAFHTRTFTRLQPEDSAYLRGGKTQDQHTRRAQADLQSLLSFSTKLGSMRGHEQLQRRLLETIFELVPANVAALLFCASGTEEIEPALSLDRERGWGGSVAVSREVVQRVLQDGAGLLSSDLMFLEPDPAAATPQVRSVLVVPLEASGETIGVVYATTSLVFEERHLQLLTAIAAIAGPALDNARHMEWLRNENCRLQSDLGVEHNMIGESPAMQEIYRFVARAARSESTILIRGESGTGKELVARALHSNSARAQRPFVAINCAALTESLLESELFGHEKGAFTGALAQKKGKIETAQSGTLFLDEIGELAPTLQAKLLRVLQERVFERVGGTRPIKVDVRLIAATNRNLEEAIPAGLFRQDLFYRLNVVAVRMPALRDRREDIPLLASYFVAKFSRLVGRSVKGISPQARKLLVQYDWPGNVRELENAMERALVLGTTELILPEDLPDSVVDASSSEGGVPSAYHHAVRDAKRKIVQKALQQAGDNYTRAAKTLGMHPNNLHRVVRELGLKRAAKA